MKWALKDPNSRIIFADGRPELNSSNLTDAKVEELIKNNPNYANQFVEKKDEEIDED